MKKFGFIAFLFLALAIFSSGVLAQAAPESFVSNVEVRVNDQVASQDSPILLERGQQVVVEVFFTGNVLGKCQIGDDNPCFDTRVEASLEGWEFGTVGDVEGPFEVEPGVSYKKVLTFTLPEDMPASDNLSLNVELKDDDNLEVFNYLVRVQEKRHDVNVFDAILNPTNNVQAGQPLFVTVRVENLGDSPETSVKVTAAMPQLGLQASEFVDRLNAADSESDDDEADDSATTNDLLLIIPEGTPEGNYDVVVTVEYNRGHTVSQETFTMHVLGKAKEPVTVPGTQTTGVTINVDNQALKVEQGQGGVYKFSVANLGQQASSFTFEVLGVQDWANLKVEPSVLVVQPNSAQDAFVYVAPKEGTEGIKMFTVKVKSNDKVLSETQLSLEVAKAQKSVNARTVFTWLFVVLLAVLVILVVVVLVKKATSKGGIETQTYY